MAKQPMSASFPKGKLRGRAARIALARAKAKTPRKVVALAKAVKRGRGPHFLFNLKPEPVQLLRVDVVLQEHTEPTGLRPQVFLCESVRERGPDGYLRPRHLQSTEITALWWRYIGAAKLLALAKEKRAAVSAAATAAASLMSGHIGNEDDGEEGAAPDDPLFGV